MAENENKNPVKEFFEKGPVMIVEASVIALASIGLLYGGVKAGTIAEIPNMALVALTGIEAIITFIQGIKKIGK